MDENASTRDSEEQAAKSWYLWKWNYGPRHEDWPDPLTEPYEHERSASQRELQREHARELVAAAESEQRRLSQALEHSTDLLSASEDQADRLVAALQHAAAGVAPEWAKTGSSVRRAEALQRRADRAQEVRNHIVAAAGALAAIAEEVALLNQGRETRHRNGPPDTST